MLIKPPAIDLGLCLKQICLTSRARVHTGLILGLCTRLCPLSNQTLIYSSYKIIKLINAKFTKAKNNDERFKYQFFHDVIPILTFNSMKIVVSNV